MKKSICFLAFALAAFFAVAQDDDSVAVKQTVYLLPAFVDGKVVFKNGAVQKASLNYNCLFQQMIFDQNGQMMAIDNTEAVDTVFIGEQKFIPADTLFFEVKHSTLPVPLYVLHTCKLKQAEQTKSAYSGVSATGAARDVDLSMYRMSVETPYRLKLPIEYAVEKTDIFFIKKGNEITRLKNSKQAKNLFPGKETAVKTFLAEHNTNFTKEPDVQEFIIFVNTLQ